MKKLLSTILAISLTFSLVTPVFADNTSPIIDVSANAGGQGSGTAASGGGYTWHDSFQGLRFTLVDSTGLRLSNSLDLWYDTPPDDAVVLEGFKIGVWDSNEYKVYEGGKELKTKSWTKINGITDIRAVPLPIKFTTSTSYQGNGPAVREFLLNHVEETLRNMYQSSSTGRYISTPSTPISGTGSRTGGNGGTNTSGESTILTPEVSYYAEVPSNYPIQGVLANVINDSEASVAHYIKANIQPNVGVASNRDKVKTQALQIVNANIVAIANNFQNQFKATYGEVQWNYIGKNIYNSMLNMKSDVVAEYAKAIESDIASIETTGTAWNSLSGTVWISYMKTDSYKTYYSNAHSRFNGWYNSYQIADTSARPASSSIDTDELLLTAYADESSSKDYLAEGNLNNGVLSNIVNTDNFSFYKSEGELYVKWPVTIVNVPYQLESEITKGQKIPMDEIYELAENWWDTWSDKDKSAVSPMIITMWMCGAYLLVEPVTWVKPFNGDSAGKWVYGTITNLAWYCQYAGKNMNNSISDYNNLMRSFGGSMVLEETVTLRNVTNENGGTISGDNPLKKPAYSDIASIKKGYGMHLYSFGELFKVPEPTTHTYDDPEKEPNKAPEYPDPDHPDTFKIDELDEESKKKVEDSIIHEIVKVYEEDTDGVINHITTEKRDTLHQECSALTWAEHIFMLNLQKTHIT